MTHALMTSLSSVKNPFVHSNLQSIALTTATIGHLLSILSVSAPSLI